MTWDRRHAIKAGKGRGDLALTVFYAWPSALHVSCSGSRLVDDDQRLNPSFSFFGVVFSPIMSCYSIMQDGCMGGVM